MSVIKWERGIYTTFVVIYCLHLSKGDLYFLVSVLNHCFGDLSSYVDF